jgi:hypothetical protein
MERDTEFPESLVYSFICISEESPLKELLHETEEKYMVTIHRATHRWKACVWWGAARFPKGIVCDSGITIPVLCSLQHDTFHFGLDRLLPLHTCYASHMTQGMELHITLRYRQGFGFMGGLCSSCHT